MSSSLPTNPIAIARNSAFLICLVLLGLRVAVQSQSVTALVDSLPDSAFSASSIYSGYEPREGRYSSSQGWYSNPCCNVPNEWLQIDLGRTVQIYSIGTKGSYPNALFGKDWTTSYQFYYSVTTPTSSFSSMTAYNSGETLTGNTDWDIERENILDTPIIARYIRYRPLGYSGNWIVLKVEAYGHDTLSPTLSPSADPSQSPSATPTTTPSNQPTMSPSSDPSAAPSLSPTSSSSAPTASSLSPTVTSSAPSKQPTTVPTRVVTASPTKRPTLPPSTANQDDQGQEQEVGESAATTDAVQDEDGRLEAGDFMLPLVVGSIAVFLCIVCVCTVMVCKSFKTGKSHEKKLQSAVGIDSVRSVSSIDPTRASEVHMDGNAEGQGVENQRRDDVVLCVENRAGSEGHIGRFERHDSEDMYDREQIEMEEMYDRVTTPASTKQTSNHKNTNTTQGDDDSDDSLSA